MSKHTPGPWAYSRWDQSGDARFYIAQADGAPYTPNYSDVATLVAETCSGERVSIQEANAQLIASAPELLEALTQCRAELLAMIDMHNQQDEDDGSWLYDYQTVVEAETAIAKARSES